MFKLIGAGLSWLAGLGAVGAVSYKVGKAKAEKCDNYKNKERAKVGTLWDHLKRLEEERSKIKEERNKLQQEAKKIAKEREELRKERRTGQPKNTESLRRCLLDPSFKFSRSNVRRPCYLEIFGKTFTVIPEEVKN